MTKNLKEEDHPSYAEFPSDSSVIFQFIQININILKDFHSSRSRKENGRNKNIKQSNPIHIGNYTLIKVIGQGTFGKVWKGIHLLTGEKVAVKIFNKNKIKDKSTINSSLK